MEHIAIDLGSKESQICVRSADGQILEERRIATRPATLRRYLEGRPASRVIVEAGAEAFWVAELVQTAGHEARVVPSALAPALGVGERGLKNDRRDAAVLSAASCRVDLPSVHIRSRQSRALQARLGMRDAAVRARTALLNVVHAHLRTIGERVRSGASQTLVDRVRERLGERATLLEPVFSSIESLNVSVAAMSKTLTAEAKHDELADRLQSVPGVGPLTALRFIATVDLVGRFRDAASLTCYIGLVPSEHSSGEREHRGSITKAGSPVMRALLVQAAWAALRCRCSDPMLEWARRIAQRRGKKVAVVALARKIARILFALWRDGSRYGASQAAAAARTELTPPRCLVAPQGPQRPRLRIVPVDASS
jgi:transposase